MDSYQKIIELGVGTPKWGIFKQPNIRFYYERILPDKDGNPTKGVASVCVIRIPAGSPCWTGVTLTDRYARGLSFCVPQDQFSKKEGRTVALGRAIQAVENRIDKNPILTKVAGLLAFNPHTLTFKAYSEYGVTLTPKEKALFNVSKENNG
jgi:hypothetical protein